MGSKCTVTINGQEIRASVGETLVDSGLGGRVLIPHDCCSGQCDSCRVTVVSGRVDDMGTRLGDTVLACQATLDGDAEIRFDEVPPPTRMTGRIVAMEPLSPEIVSVEIALPRPLTYLPGQYVSAKFLGFPYRDYSPSPGFNGTLDERRLILHIKILPGGVVSGELGRSIRVGHKVTVRGPHGHAFWRSPQPAQRTVLTSTGTGWAPIWAIARQACLRGEQEGMSIVVGARDGANIYMRPCFDWLHKHGVRDIVVVNSRNVVPPAIRGRPTDHLPEFGPGVTVYAAGAPAFVNAVQSRALASGAICHADPFLPSVTSVSFGDRVSRWIMSGRQSRADRTGWNTGAGFRQWTRAPDARS